MAGEHAMFIIQMHGHFNSGAAFLDESIIFSVLSVVTRPVADLGEAGGPGGWSWAYVNPRDGDPNKLSGIMPTFSFGPDGGEPWGLGAYYRRITRELTTERDRVAESGLCRILERPSSRPCFT
jgi:hypothetical protein